MNPGEHWCWWILVHACVVWYSTVTIYVAVKGSADVKSMLRRLASQQDPLGESESPPSSAEK